MKFEPFLFLPEALWTHFLPYQNSTVENILYHHSNNHLKNYVEKRCGGRCPTKSVHTLFHSNERNNAITLQKKIISYLNKAKSNCKTM